MKKIFKVLVNVLALCLGVFAAFTMTACKDIKTVEVKLSIYNYTDNAFEEKTLTVDLYRHLAPKTVDNVLSAIKDGYYDGAVAYKNEGANYISLGEFKADGDSIVKQADRPTVEGEFKANGVDGSNLSNKKGYVGLWRSYTKDGGSFTVSDSARNSGTAVWYMPTATKADMDGYFAVFGKFDLDSTANSEAFTMMQTVLTGSNYDSYEVFYTGESKDALTVHVIKTSELEIDENYDEAAGSYGGETIYEAKGSDLASFDKHTVYMPKVENGAFAIVVKSVKIK